VVNGIPMIMFPGLTDHGVFMNLASPANLSDPDYTVWEMSPLNPIESGTTDYSTAWQSDQGEWRATNHDGSIVSSFDFKEWLNIPDRVFDGGDCPELIKLPRLCDKCNQSMPVADGQTPTHVYKSSAAKTPDGMQGDGYQFGVYEFGAANTSGTWSNTSAYQAYDFARNPCGGQMCGNVYASKSFFDTKKQRQVWFGWNQGSPGQVGETLPREITNNPAFTVLQFYPIEEVTSLRNSTLVHKESESPAPAHQFFGGGWPSAGRQTEIIAEFSPAAHGRAQRLAEGSGIFGLCLAVPAAQNQTSSCPLRLELAFVPGGGALNVSITSTENGEFGQDIMQVFEDEAIEVRVFLDQTVVEVYVNQGRSVMSALSLPRGDDLGVSIFSNATGIDLESVSAYSIKPAWVEQL
jgi:hypothetical protein